MNTDDSELWKAALAGVQEITKGRTNGYLTHLEYQRSDGNRLMIKVNGPSQERDWLNDRLRENFERELWQLTQKFYTVEFMLNIPTAFVLPTAGDRFGMWIEWGTGRDMPVVAGCWKLLECGSLQSGYTPEELSRAMQIIGKALPVAVIRKEMQVHLRRLEFVEQ